MSTILLGILTLTILYTMGATHTWGGVNYADAFNISMTMVGAGFLLLGVGMFVSVAKVWASTGGLEGMGRAALKHPEKRGLRKRVKMTSPSI